LPPNPAAFKASAKEPPISPVPIMVICLNTLLPETEISLLRPKTFFHRSFLFGCSRFS
jgi:hypothetical protein